MLTSNCRRDAQQDSLLLDQRCLTSPLSPQSIEKLLDRPGTRDRIDQASNPLLDRLELTRSDWSALPSRAL